MTSPDPERPTLDGGTVTPCPHGCGGTVRARDISCASCRRDLAAVEIQPPGSCWTWWGPQEHRMRCRKPVEHRGPHSTHDDCGHTNGDGNRCGDSYGHDAPSGPHWTHGSPVTPATLDELERVYAAAPGPVCVHPNGTSVWSGTEYDSDSGDIEGQFLLVRAAPSFGDVSAERSVNALAWVEAIWNAAPALIAAGRLVAALTAERDGMAERCEALRQLRAAYQDMVRERNAVKDWMAAEGAAGNLRRNGDAPAWQAHEVARVVFEATVQATLAAPLAGGGK